jgi:hypothetical protein
MLKGYRTYIVNAIVSLFAALPALLPGIAENLSNKTMSMILFFVGIGNILLRSITNTPAGKSASDEANGGPN